MSKKTPCKCVDSDIAFFRKFPQYYEIEWYIQKIARRHPNLVRLEEIGHSIQGRTIWMVVIQNNRFNPKNAVLIEGGIHAREWLSHTTVLYFIHHILKTPDLLGRMDYYIIPCLNPDGYVYSHTCERLWRKNMNWNGTRNRKWWGVDINRNFPYGYGLPGSSSCPSSFMYRGKFSLSEPEAQSEACVFHKYGRYIKLFVAIHAYGNIILYPWGFTKRPLPDERDLRKCAKKAVCAMKCAYANSKFRIGPLAKAMYLSSGGSSDYARGTHKIKFSYTMELHKCGKSGFTPRPSKILRVAKETVVGLTAMVEHVDSYYCTKIRKRKRSPCMICKNKRVKRSCSSSPV